MPRHDMGLKAGAKAFSQWTSRLRWELEVASRRNSSPQSSASFFAAATSDGNIGLQIEPSWLIGKSMTNVKAILKGVRRVARESKGQLLRKAGLLNGDWKINLPEELQFWEKALGNEGRNWDQNEYRERTDPNFELQEELKVLIPAPAAAVVRILDVGAGPLTRLGKHWQGRDLQIVAVDPLAEEYGALIVGLGLRPLVPVTFAHGVKLTERFPSNSLDLAYASNSLDHSYDPLIVIQQMLAVVKPLNFVYLWHFANVGRVESYAGLHQWNFDIRDAEFVMDDGRTTQSVVKALSGRAEVTCEFVEAFGAKVVVAKLKKLASF